MLVQKNFIPSCEKLGNKNLVQQKQSMLLSGTPLFRNTPPTLVRCQEEIFHQEGGEALKRVAQRLWIPHPWKHSRLSWMESRDVVVGSPTHGLELNNLLGPLQSKPFHDSMILIRVALNQLKIPAPKHAAAPFPLPVHADDAQCHDGGGAAHDIHGDEHIAKHLPK